MEGVNELDADARNMIPHIDEMESTLEDARKVHEDMISVLEDIDSSIKDGHYPKDIELAATEMYLRKVKEIMTSLEKQTKALLEKNHNRFFTTLVERGATGIKALGKSFSVNGKLNPIMPSVTKDPEAYAEMIADLKESQYVGYVREEVKWQSMRTICNELSEEGKPLPKHVKVFPKPSVTMR